MQQEKIKFIDNRNKSLKYKLMKYRLSQENAREKQQRNFLIKLGLARVVMGVGRAGNSKHR